jgi:hypothetical protein
MKKTVFCCILSIFASFFLTCKQSFNYDDSAAGDVVYSEDGKNVTIYFDGGESANAPSQAALQAGRSLSKVNAQTGHDFFEVIFYYENGATDDVIAGAAWEKGKNANVSGVMRTIGGVNYSHVSIGPALPAGEGAAVLFAGKKSDKTLLAVGEICEVDGVPIASIPGGFARITTTTKSVSFELNALSAGAKVTAAGSSFLTGATVNPAAVSVTNTKVKNAGFAGRTFPLFILDKGVTVNAKYTIDVHSSVHPIGYYLPGIICKGDNPTSEVPNVPYAKNIYPRYTDENNNEVRSTVIKWNSLCSVNLTNNKTANQPFNNEVGFTINTVNDTGADGKHVVFAIEFGIPVYALYVPTEDKEYKDREWVIRPGYDQYNQELDDGKGGKGGAILIGIGSPDDFS